uniref:Uncharacterized protein n=1 Tax=Anguilla anguilla TaxID=7936 RepID=A0A0E9VXC0_ANGAN
MNLRHINLKRTARLKKACLMLLPVKLSNTGGKTPKTPS